MLGVAVVTIGRTALGCTVDVKVDQVMALAAVNLPGLLLMQVLLVSRSGMALVAIQLGSMHRGAVGFHRYAKPALPTLLAVAPDTLLRLIGEG